MASQLASGVSQIFSTQVAFAALKADGSVVTWGYGPNGADSSAVASQLASGVSQIFSTVSAFAALKADSSVVTWGAGSSGGESSAVASQLASGVAGFANPFTNDWLNGGNGTASAITTQNNAAFSEGVTLFAGSISNEPDGNGTINGYQWFNNGVAISGATGSSFATTATTFGSYRVDITYQDSKTFIATVSSTDQVVAKIDNGNGTVAPFITSGVLQEGVTLTAAAVSGDPDGTATNPNYSYQWLLNGAAITGATSSSYNTTATGFGSYSLKQTYIDNQGFSATLTTADQTIAKVDNGNGTVAPFTASGSLQEGVTLTAAAVSADPDGLSLNPNYSYQWLLNGADITGATSSSYSTTATGFGSYSLKQTYTDDQGYTATLTTADQTIAKIDNGNGTVAPFIASGVLREGVTLTAAAVSGDPDGTATNPNYSYQWLLNSADITGATSSSYSTTATGFGSYSLKQTYTDDQGYTATLTTADQEVVKSDPPNLRFSNAGSGTVTVSDPINAIPATANLRATLSSRAGSVNQIGYVVLNASEVANSAALLADLTWLRDRARSLFYSLESTDVTLPAGSSFDRDIQLNNGQSIRFFEVQDASVDQLTGLADSRFLLFNSGDFTNSQVAFSSTSGVRFSLNLLPNDADLNALISQPQGLAAVLDLSAFTKTQRLSGTLAIAREAAFNSVAGFYRTLDAAGTVLKADGITGIRPGESGYNTAALHTDNLIGQLGNLSVGNNQTTTRSFSGVTGDTFLVPFAQVNGNTFFAYAPANSDGISYFHSLGNNLFGFEDTLGGGDRDFDDMVIGFNFSSVT